MVWLGVSELLLGSYHKNPPKILLAAKKKISCVYDSPIKDWHEIKNLLNVKYCGMATNGGNWSNFSKSIIGQDSD